MTWTVDNNSALVAVTEHVYVLRVDVDRLPDEINYEAIVGDRFATLSAQAQRLTDSVVVLTSKVGFEMLRDISKSTALVGPKVTADLISKAIHERHAVVMRWRA